MSILRNKQYFKYLTNLKENAAKLIAKEDSEIKSFPRFSQWIRERK